MRHESVDRALARGNSDDADASAIATATVRAVSLLLGELRPLVGAMASRALYARSLHLARESFQRPGPADPETEDELAPLQADLAARDPADARRAGQALLQAFVDLLVSLIGKPLTDRMLRTAWDVPGQEQPLQEKQE